MQELETIFKRIDGYREDVIHIQKELTARIALGPQNGGTGEHEKTKYIKTLIESIHPIYSKEIRVPDANAEDGISL